MRKGASRNMQRIGLKVSAGVAPPERGSTPAPFYKQLHAMELHRLARIRYAFELEQEIQQKLGSGDSVGLLRERLNGVRNGTIEPPRYADARVSGRSKEKLKVQAAAAPAKTQRGPKRLYASERQLLADLADLAKGKLTLTGVATVKGLLDRFDSSFAAEILALNVTFVETIRASSVYALAPDMSAADGLLLASVLTEKATDSVLQNATPPNERPAASGSQDTHPPRSGRYISVDSITAPQYMVLRTHGWSIAGDRLYPPDGWNGELPTKLSGGPIHAPAAQRSQRVTSMPTPAPTKNLEVRKDHRPLNERAALDVKTAPGKSRHTITLPKRG